MCLSFHLPSTKRPLSELPTGHIVSLNSDTTVIRLLLDSTPTTYVDTSNTWRVEVSSGECICNDPHETGELNTKHHRNRTQPKDLRQNRGHNIPSQVFQGARKLPCTHRTTTIRIVSRDSLFYRVLTASVLLPDTLSRTLVFSLPSTYFWSLPTRHDPYDFLPVKSVFLNGPDYLDSLP